MPRGLVYDNSVGSESLNPLDELRGLDRQVDEVPDLAGLKPIFARLDEIARAHSGDFEVQLAADDVKLHVVRRGKALREMPPADSVVIAPAPPAFQPPPTPEPTPVRAPAPTPVRPAAQAAQPGSATAWRRPLMVGVIGRRGASQ